MLCFLSEKRTFLIIFKQAYWIAESKNNLQTPETRTKNILRGYTTQRIRLEPAEIMVGGH
jgi:hypothetical protein